MADNPLFRPLSFMMPILAFGIFFAISEGAIGTAAFLSAGWLVGVVALAESLRTEQSDAETDMEMETDTDTDT